MNGNLARLSTGEDRLGLRNSRRRKLADIVREANQLSHAAANIAQAAEESLASPQQSAFAVQPQINFLNGSLARLIKDWAVLEHLQTVYHARK